MKHYKVGDITPNGWEVIDVSYNPQYQMRKRIRVISDGIWCNGEKINIKGITGYYYINHHFKWIVTDDGKQLRLRHDEFEYVEELIELAKNK